MPENQGDIFIGYNIHIKLYIMQRKVLQSETKLGKQDKFYERLETKYGKKEVV